MQVEIQFVILILCYAKLLLSMLLTRQACDAGLAGILTLCSYVPPRTVINLPALTQFSCRI